MPPRDSFYTAVLELFVEDGYVKLDNWQYDKDEDTWTCVTGQKLTIIRGIKE